MISNPAQWFINGNDTREFTYEGGNRLYHFSPHDNHLSKTLENNLIFSANDLRHAYNVLIRMLEFRLAIPNFHSDYAHQEIGKKRAKLYLDAIKAGKVKLTEAPNNQFYQVGWASNDTIL